MARVSSRVDEKCKVTCTDNDKTIDAVVVEFQEKSKLVLAINKTVKIILKWNGKIYVGANSGLEFISNGPSITTYKVSR